MLAIVVGEIRCRRRGRIRPARHPPGRRRRRSRRVRHPAERRPRSAACRHRAASAASVGVRCAADLVRRRLLAAWRLVRLVAFQQRIALQLLLDEGADLEIGELQQLDRLPQLRRHHQ